MSKKTFMQGAVILGVAGIIIKALGAAFRIPLANVIGEDGMGYYSTAYPVYVLFLTLSTAGIPTAISKMVAERESMGDYKEAHRVFRISFLLLFAIGCCSMLILFFGADFIVGIVSKKEMEAVYCMMAIAPALLLVSMMAAFRGYFQGMQDMKPTAISQVIEQLFRVALGLYLAYLLLPKGVAYAAVGASFGATAGGFGGLCCIIFIYFYRRSSIQERLKRTTHTRKERARTILARIVMIAVPITIGASIMPIMNNIDLAIVINQLTDAGMTEKAARGMYGQLAGMATPLINFPQVLSMSIAMSLVPVIAYATKQKDMQFLRHNVNLGIRTSMIIGLPCGVGLFVLAEPIMLLLYPMQRASAVSAAPCLAILAIGVIFLSLVQTLTGILQGVGKQMIPVRNLFIGAVFKAVITYQLVSNLSINVKGAAVGTVVAYAIAVFLNMIAVKKYTGTKFDFRLSFVKPGIAAVAMGVVVYFSYMAISMIFGNAISTLLSICIGAAVYAALLIYVRAISSEDVKFMPKGARLAGLLQKFNR